jgi:hypothetical protein
VFDCIGERQCDSSVHTTVRLCMRSAVCTRALARAFSAYAPSCRQSGANQRAHPQ